MKTKLTNWLIVLGLFITLASCEDHRIPTGQRFRIKKATPTYADPSGSSFAVYNYDDNNRLLNTLNYSVVPNFVEPYIFGRKTLYYDDQGRLTKFEDKVEDNGINRVPSTYQRTTYEYDTNNSIIAVKKYKVFFGDPSHPIIQEERQLLYYGSSPFPIKVMGELYEGTQSNPNPVQESFVEEYTWSGGNLVGVKRTNTPTSPNLTPSTSIRTIQYDDKPNPFYGFPGPNGMDYNKIENSAKVIWC